MSHDPLCRRRITEALMGGCPECNLIDKVREDMLAKCIKVVRTHRISGYFCSCDEENTIEKDHVENVLRALQEKPTPPPLPPSVGVPEKRGSLW